MTGERRAASPRMRANLRGVHLAQHLVAPSRWSHEVNQPPT